MTSTKLPGRPRCPQCREVVDGVTSLEEGVTPSTDGTSLTVCVFCATLLVLTKNGLRRLTQREFMRLDEDTKRQLGNAVYAIRKVLQAN